MKPLLVSPLNIIFLQWGLRVVTKTVDEFVGKRLRARRKFLGLTQDAVAKHLGVTFQQVQKYELGRNRVTSSVLYELSVILKVPVDYFFEGHNSKITKISKIEDKIMNSKEVGELVMAYDKIKEPKVKSEFSELIAALSSMYSKSG